MSNLKMSRPPGRLRSRTLSGLWRLSLVGVGLLAAFPAWGQEPQGFYRFPALHGETIVFAAEGDLWTVSLSGGTARRLTSHPGEETDPVVSPDGRTLAFTASYEGPAELYTMPLAGGLPIRWTYEVEPSVATAWTPDGRLVYTTTAYAMLPKPQVVALDLDSGARERIPLAEASEAVFDGTGRTVFFVRPAFHRNVTKRYRGGTARQIWRFTEDTAEAERLTEGHAGEHHSPMWWDGRVYFVTDPDGTMNLWSMDERGSDSRQHTRHSGWDVKEPSLSEGRIVYQMGADLWLYDIARDQSRLIPITLASDFDQLRERWVEDPMEYLTAAHLNPDGTSVVLTARGRVFVAPARQGRLVRVTHEPGVRYRDVVFMPDGDRLLGLTDASGELEFATLPANGIGRPDALTADGAILRFQGHPSPDGEWVAYRDHNRDVWLLNVSTRAQRVISSTREGVTDIAWSPDSRWLTFSQTAINTFQQIILYGVEQGTSTPITSDRVNSRSAVWSPDGRWIYFLSDRHLRSVVGNPWGPRQPEPFFDRPMKLYELSLQPGQRSRFRPDDELAATRDGLEESDTLEDAEREPIEIDLEGVTHRVREVPVAPGNYRTLGVNETALFWLTRELGSTTRDHLVALEIDNAGAEPERLVEDVRGFEVSRSGEKLLARREGALYVIDAEAEPPDDLSDTRVDLSGWTFPIDVREDWRQIFIDAWRLERDYFYDPGMHGVDWGGVRDKYLPLVDRVTTRDELSDLIGRVVGELSALHTSVRGGERREGQDDVRVAALGARLVRDVGERGYRIDYVYQSDPDYPDELSPLPAPDLGIREGDVIEAINGVDTLAVRHPNALLRNQAGRQVLLRVRSTLTQQVRDVIVTPTADEGDLRYRDWEYTRRRRVEVGAEGALGYVHLRAMGPSDITAWYRQFYPVFDRPGLILDMRRNRGGNIDSFILEKLMRRAWSYWKSRHREPYWNMQYAFRGHMVVLVDQNTASDGEAFAEGFRRLGLGKVIGTRTWGGEIWLSPVNRLSDDGLARAPMSGVYGPEGEWLIENHGLEPDNLPHATFNGEDAQLDAAIAFLLGEVRRDPRPVPEAPPFPDKSFTYPTTDATGMAADRP